MSDYDLVVVGAGPSGLIASHTWLTLHPQSKVILFEAGSTVGGAWSKDRVYPTMMTQTPVGMLEFSSYPMSPPKEMFYHLCSGDHVYQYLDQFSESTKFGGKTISDRIHFNSEVEQIYKSGDVWVVRTSSGVEACSGKLIMATGPTSIPSMPPFLREKTSVPVLHSKDLARNSEFLVSSAVQDVTVIGGSKSAFDAVYLLARAGKNVSWVIRRGGQGPGNLAMADGGGLFKNSHEIISLKLVAKTSPCIFEPENGWTRALHQWRIGRWLVKGIWTMVSAMWQASAKYQRDDNFAQLKPDRSAYWCSDNIGVQNTADLWDVVSRATVFRDEVVEIGDHSATLASGKKVACDAVVACTGWDVSYPMFTKEDTIELGLPVPAADMPLPIKKHWDGLIATADESVIKRFPALAETSIRRKAEAKVLPNRFYRSIAPIQDLDRSIAFLGQIGATQSLTIAEIQSLWAVAYLTDQLKVPSEQKTEEDVAQRIAWRRRRYLADGHTMIYDQIAVSCSL